MDARDFAGFLRKKMQEKADSYNEILYSVSFTTMEEGARLAGIRTTLVSISNSLGDLLKEFYERND
jgi:hypothetical protein